MLVGAAIGYLTSEYVYHRHHNPQLAGSTWEIPSHYARTAEALAIEVHGSPYVPLDSWIYPALERLIALGYIDSAIAACVPGLAWNVRGS